MAHKARQVFEVAPELIDLFRRKIYEACAFRLNAPVIAAAELHGADHVERSDGKYVRCRKRDASELCVRIGGGHTESSEIYRITDDARPHSLRRFLLSKDGDARTDFAQTVQSY